MAIRDSHGRFARTGSTTDRASGVRIVDKDNGYDALMKASATWGDKSIRIGVLDKDGGESHGGGTTVIDVATWNEFGVKDEKGDWKIPPRSFIRAFGDQERAEAVKLLKRLYALVVMGRMTEEKALDMFGVWAVGRIQARIAQGIPPANADSTVRRKGSSTPLIDTGQLRSSISFEVEK
jgi:hypothetical protein